MAFKAFRGGRKSVSSELNQAVAAVLEPLEGRLMLSTHRHTTATVPNELITGGTIREGGSAATGATLTEIQTTYGISELSTYSAQYPLFDNSGNGQTLVIIGAAAAQVNDNLPTRLGNINIFSGQEGIPGLIDPVYIDPVGDVDQTGQSDEYGAVESTMELEWAHAMAPAAQIIFVEVPSINGVIAPGNMELGIEEAVKDVQLDGLVAQSGPINQFLPGGVVDVGLSSTGEDPTLTAQYDSLFSYKYAKDVSFIAPSGETGGIVSMPANSQWVTSVGGTVFNTLTTLPNGQNPQIASPVTGGGASEYEALPSYQKGIKVNGKALRTRSGPDLAMVSQVQGEGVYCYYDPTPTDDAANKTYTVEGTTVAAALFTGAMADMNELRYSLGLSPIGRDLNNEMYALYKENPTAYFTDITQGTNTRFNAYAGFDLATGMGSPNLDALIPGLAGIQPAEATNVTGIGDLYESLSTPLSGNAITTFTGLGTAQVSSQFVTFNDLIYTNDTTLTVSGSTTVTTTTATFAFTTPIGVTTNGTFNADATVTLASATTGGTATTSTLQVAVVGRVSGSLGHYKLSGQFYTIDARGKKILPGAISVFQGSFSS